MEEYESFLRKTCSHNNQILYRAIDTFDQAKQIKNVYVIFEGDYGGIIYLTCPMKLVNCTENELQALLEYIDELYWNDLDGANIFYEILRSGQCLTGGLGGGQAIDDIWIHPEIKKLGLDSLIKKRLTKTSH